MRRRVSCSSPFDRLTTGTHGRRWGASSRAVARIPWEGTPITSTSAAATASARSAVACRLGCSSKPGRYCSLRWSSRTWSATSARRAHSVVGALRAQRWAIVVPHDPAPITATCIGMVGEVTAPGRR